MRLRVHVLTAGTRVRVRTPRAGERGTWVVTARVAGSGPVDPAYEVRREASGRCRIFRRSRLRLVRPAARRPAGLPGRGERGR